MFNLNNLKAGQTKTEGDVSVSKTDEGYEVSLANVAAGALSYDKASKQWTLTSNGRVSVLADATAKTVVDVVIEHWTGVKLEPVEETQPTVEDESEPEPELEPEPTPVPSVELDVVESTSEPEPEPASESESEPEPESKATSSGKVDEEERRARKIDQILKALQLAKDGRGDEHQTEAALAMIASLMARYSITNEMIRRRKAELSGESIEDEKIISWTYDINTVGNFGKHRVVAFATVCQAMGAQAFWSQVKGQGYKGRMTLHVHGHASVVENIKLFLPVMDIQMERLALKAARGKSRELRLAGGHHSSGAYYAKAGFMRGFGSGVAHRISMSQDDDLYDGSEDAGGKALVIRDRQNALEAYMKEKFPKIKTERRQKFDFDAWHDGRKAGIAFASPQLAGPES